MRVAQVSKVKQQENEQMDDWKEKDQRSIKWIPLKRAAKRADDEELSVLLKALAQSDAKALRQIASDLKKAS